MPPENVNLHNCRRCHYENFTWQIICIENVVDIIEFVSMAAFEVGALINSIYILFVTFFLFFFFVLFFYCNVHSIVIDNLLQSILLMGQYLRARQIGFCHQQQRRQ